MRTKNLKIPQIFSSIFIIIVSLSVSLLSIEIGLRFYDRYFKPKPDETLNSWDVVEFSSTRHHKLVPNSYMLHQDIEYEYMWKNNALGMRDREHSVEKDAQSFRILFLGDSMVQGYGVAQEQTMTALLEDSLNQPKREKIIEVLNAGVFGYSPLLEYLYVQKLIPLVEPDMVIVGFTLANDVGDDYFYTQNAQVNQEDGSLYFNDDNLWPWSAVYESFENSPEDETDREVGNTAQTLKHVIQSILLKSRLVNLINTAQAQYDQSRKQEEDIQHGRDFVEAHKDDIRVNLGLVNDPVLTQEQRFEYWQLSLGYLADIHTLLQENDIPMVLVVIPDYDTNATHFDEPHMILEEFGQEHSIPTIHLLPEFEKYSNEIVVYPIDGHWNPKGNRIAASVVDAEIRKLELPPPIVKSLNYHTIWQRCVNC